jgi:hypothetical protein
VAIPLLPIVAALIVTAAVATAVSSRLRASSPRRAVPRNPGRGRRRVVLWGFGAAGIILAVSAGLALGQRAIFLAGPLAISGYLAGLLLGELMMAPPARGVLRRGSLDRRSLDRYMRPAWVWGWRAAAGAASIALVVAGAVGGADGRSLPLDCTNGTSSVSSPWPGWSYGGPALVALMVGALLVEVSIRRILSRPRPDAASVDFAADEANRAASLRRAVAAGTAIALVPLAGVSLSAATILSFACSAPNSLAWTAPVALVLALVGFLAGMGVVLGLATLIRITEDDLATPPAGTGSVPQWS